MKLYFKIYILNILPVFICSVVIGTLSEWTYAIPGGIVLMGLCTVLLYKARHKEPERVIFHKVNTKFSHTIRSVKDTDTIYEEYIAHIKELSHLNVIKADKKAGKIVANTSVSWLGGAGEKVIIFIHPQENNESLVKMMSYSICCGVSIKNYRNIQELKTCVS